MHLLLLAVLLSAPADRTVGGDLFVDGLALNWASENVDAGSVVVGLAAAGQNVWVEFGTGTEGETRDFTTSSGEITSLSSGTIVVIYAASASDGTNTVYESGVSVNDVIQAGCRSSIEGVPTGTRGQFAAVCLLTVSDSDVLKLEFRGTDAVPADLTVYDASIVAIRM